VWKWKILEDNLEKVLALQRLSGDQVIGFAGFEGSQRRHNSFDAGHEADHAMQSVLSLSDVDNQLSLLSLRPEGTISVLHHTARITTQGKFTVFIIRARCFASMVKTSRWGFISSGLSCWAVKASCPKMR
jgi:hypothetical protein